MRKGHALGSAISENPKPDTIGIATMKNLAAQLIQFVINCSHGS
jgi:hypothetical protein